jgi:hypothetical protein
MPLSLKISRYSIDVLLVEVNFFTLHYIDDCLGAGTLVLNVFVKITALRTEQW